MPHTARSLPLSAPRPACVRDNVYRESKFWMPVKIWVQRKRVDLAYRAYLIRRVEREKMLQLKVDSDRLTAELKEEAKKELKQLKTSQLTHFAFLERAAAYHIMKVRHPQPQPRRDRPRRPRGDPCCDFVTLTCDADPCGRATTPSLERRSR